MPDPDPPDTPPDIPPDIPHGFWQELLPAGQSLPSEKEGRFVDAWPARLPDGRALWLPIRRLPDRPDRGVASLILNQASFTVVDALSRALAARLNEFSPDIIVGLPILGLTLASHVAQALEHRRYVPCGNSRKFWYDDSLSAPVRSITSPDVGKRIFLDPRLLPLLRGRRVGLVDDALSSGRTIVAGLDLLESVGIEPVAIGCAMLQTDAWRRALAARAPHLVDRVTGVFTSPLLHWEGAFWRV